MRVRVPAEALLGLLTCLTSYRDCYMWALAAESFPLIPYLHISVHPHGYQIIYGVLLIHDMAVPSGRKSVV